MKINYVFHSGFLLETETCYYLFDYYKGGLRACDTEKPLIVLASHAHQDHYNPDVWAYLQELGYKTVLAVLAKDISKRKYPKNIEVLRVRADESYELPFGGRLTTLRSTDSGVAFLLSTPEGTVYHAGDLNDWTWREETDSDNAIMRAAYRKEIDKLSKSHIDAAFVPLDPRQEEHYADGMLYFLEHTDVGAVYPMHYWQKPEVIIRFLTEYPQYKATVRYTENSMEGKD